MRGELGETEREARTIICVQGNEALTLAERGRLDEGRPVAELGKVRRDIVELPRQRRIVVGEAQRLRAGFLVSIVNLLPYGDLWTVIGADRVKIFLSDNIEVDGHFELLKNSCAWQFGLRKEIARSYSGIEQGSRLRAFRPSHDRFRWLMATIA
jgi:hypothetical protein